MSYKAEKHGYCMAQGIDLDEGTYHAKTNGGNSGGNGNGSSTYKINSSRFNNASIQGAFNQSKNLIKHTVDSLRKYNEAIDYFLDILDGSGQGANKHEKEVLQTCYDMLRQCMSGAVRNRQITVSRASATLQPRIAAVIALQNKLIARSMTDSLWMPRRFALSLDKAIAYRLAEKRTPALQVLDSMLLWVTDTAKRDLVEYWKCVIVTENRVISGMMSSDSLRNKPHCIAAIMHIPLPVHMSKTTVGMEESVVEEEAMLTLYPNPAQTVVAIEWLSGGGLSSGSIYDLHGQQVLKFSVRKPAGNAHHEVDISSLSTGVYLVQLQDGENSFTRKLVISH
jgi:hypothetical protein